VSYESASGVQTIYFYGADGRKVTSYAFTISSPNIVLTPAQNYGNVYFAGAPLETEGNAVSTDRLGSVRNGGPGSLGYQAEYPYGIEYSLTANDREKYATYTRDSVSGLDYAMNRYYWSQWGRFTSPDPYGGSASIVDPQSWNRYTYAGNDPLAWNDPSGLDPYCGPNMIWEGEGCIFGSGSQEPDGEGNGGIWISWIPGSDGCGFLYGTVCGIIDSGGGAGPGPVANPVPVGSCSLELEDRPLLHGIGSVLSGVNLHLFLDFTPAYGPSQMVEGEHTGKLLTATTNGDSTFGHGDGPVQGPAVCAALPILAADVSRINGGNITYSALGPNSNSAMRYMLQSISYLTALFGQWYGVPDVILSTGGYYAPLPGVETPSRAGNPIFWR